MAMLRQIWYAVSTDVLVAIVKKQLHLEVSLYTFLQMLSVSIFEKTELSCALQQDDAVKIQSEQFNQLNLFGNLTEHA